MSKKLIVLLLCVSLILTFVACGTKKDDKKTDSSEPSSSSPTSSEGTSSDPTQDYEADKWEEGAGLTDEEREELEELWGEISSNLSSSGAEIQVPGSNSSNVTSGSNGSSSNNASSNNSSSSVESSTSSNSSSSGGVLDGTSAEITTSVPTLH